MSRRALLRVPATASTRSLAVCAVLILLVPTAAASTEADTHATPREGLVPKVSSLDSGEPRDYEARPVQFTAAAFCFDPTNKLQNLLCTLVLIVAYVLGAVREAVEEACAAVLPVSTCWPFPLPIPYPQDIAEAAQDDVREVLDELREATGFGPEMEVACAETIRDCTQGVQDVLRDYVVPHLSELWDAVRP